ncbi:MAG: glycosyltransferase [Planctomycetota bacterium]
MNVDTILIALAALAVVFSALPLAMTLWNLTLYTRSDARAKVDHERRIFVCIPARNEQDNIEACVRSLLDNDHPSLRVVVYDDQSDDRTPEILSLLRAEDPRVLSVRTSPLPEGWNGKQHACWRMGRAVSEGDLGEPPLRDDELVLFTDADVRFSADCLRRSQAERDRLDADLLSTFPRQKTNTPSEAVVVPMMFYLLLGYLPIARMRATIDPATSAGCGQFILMTGRGWRAVDGHAVCKSSMHDGIKLPRAVRAAGLKSDLFDGTDLVSVRMYRGLAETWRGFAKNAYEGLGSVGLLCFMTVVHLLGHLLPWGVLIAALAGVELTPIAVSLAGLAALLQLTQRLTLARRLRHAVLGALLHPVGVAMMTAIQWHSYFIQRAGRRAWRGRVLTSAPEPDAT